MSTPRHLFISYSSKDMVFAKELYKFLVERGYEIWFDVEKHHFGDWREPVRDAIRNTVAVLLVVTADSSKSEPVKLEWEYALQNAVTVIPVVLSSVEDIDQRLRTFSRVDFTDFSTQKWDSLLQKLVARYSDLGIKVFAPSESSEHLKQLVSYINSHLPNLQESAVRELGELPNEIEYIEPVFRQILCELTSPNFKRVREEAVHAMRRHPNSVFLVNLHAALRDENSTIRHIAAEALGELGDKSSESDLIATLKDQDPIVRMAAAYALGLLKSRHAVPQLQLLLQDEHAGVRERAQEALNQIEKS